MGPLLLTEEEEKPADLSLRIVFNSKKKIIDSEKDQNQPETKSKKEKNSKKKSNTASKLSFQDYEEDDDENGDTD